MVTLRNLSVALTRSPFGRSRPQRCYTNRLAGGDISILSSIDGTLR